MNHIFELMFFKNSCFRFLHCCYYVWEAIKVALLSNKNVD